MTYIGNVPAPEAIKFHKEITAVSGTNTITTTGYALGAVEVYVDGLRLPNSDFTATDGTDIILSGMTGGETVIIDGFSDKNFQSIANSLPILDSSNNSILSETNGQVYLGDAVNFPQTYYCRLSINPPGGNTPIYPVQWDNLQGDTTNMQFVANSNNEELRLPRKGLWFIDFNCQLYEGSSTDGEFNVSAEIRSGINSVIESAQTHVSDPSLVDTGNHATYGVSSLNVNIHVRTLVSVTTVPYDVMFTASSLFDNDVTCGNDISAYIILLRPFS